MNADLSLSFFSQVRIEEIGAKKTQARSEEEKLALSYSRFQITDLHAQYRDQFGPFEQGSGFLETPQLVQCRRDLARNYHFYIHGPDGVKCTNQEGVQPEHRYFETIGSTARPMPANPSSGRCARFAELANQWFSLVGSAQKSHSTRNGCKVLFCPTENVLSEELLALLEENIKTKMAAHVFGGHIVPDAESLVGVLRTQAGRSGAPGPVAEEFKFNSGPHEAGAASERTFQLYLRGLATAPPRPAAHLRTSEGTTATLGAAPKSNGQPFTVIPCSDFLADMSTEIKFHIFPKKQGGGSKKRACNGRDIDDKTTEYLKAAKSEFRFEIPIQVKKAVGDAQSSLDSSTGTGKWETVSSRIKVKALYFPCRSDKNGTMVETHPDLIHNKLDAEHGNVIKVLPLLAPQEKGQEVVVPNGCTADEVREMMESRASINEPTVDAYWNGRMLYSEQSIKGEIDLSAVIQPKNTSSANSNLKMHVFGRVKILCFTDAGLEVKHNKMGFATT